MVSSNKRMRGIAVSRPIIIGSTATPLSDAEKLTAPPDHTHKWTVAVRSAASNPLPTVPGFSASSKADVATAGRPKTPAADEGSAGGSGTPGVSTGVSTRGREQETDYHKMVGGKDDLSHFVKRVQIKLHETYPQSTRNIDRPPFQVTETGWGEFDIQIKIFFQPESGEKPVTCFHRLKLHPWHPIAVYHQDPATAPAPALNTGADESAAADQVPAPAESAENEQDVTMAEVAPPATDPDVAAEAPQQVKLEDGTLPNKSLPPPPPVVHSWTYDEIVFPEPTEVFYDVLLAHPPTPLPSTSAQAFGDPGAFRSYKAALEQLEEGRDLNADSGIKPPHPLHNTSGALFDALSQEAIQSEAERLDKARAFAIQELEETRKRLIEGEKLLRESRKKGVV